MGWATILLNPSNPYPGMAPIVAPAVAGQPQWRQFSFYSQSDLALDLFPEPFAVRPTRLPCVSDLEDRAHAPHVPSDLQSPASISATSTYSGQEGSLLVAVDNRITLYSTSRSSAASVRASRSACAPLH